MTPDRAIHDHGGDTRHFAVRQHGLRKLRPRRLSEEGNDADATLGHPEAGYTRTMEGEYTELAGSLQAMGISSLSTPERLGIWLRQHEPTLWWDYDVALAFQRTGRQRLIRLSLREPSRAGTGSITQSVTADVTAVAVTE